MSGEPTARPVASAPDWESEIAPKVSTARLMLPVLVFAAWVLVLAWMSARRWFGALL